MSRIKTIAGDYAGSVANFALVVSRFNSKVVDALEAGAVATLRKHGVAENSITIIRVPGALELPLAAKLAGESGNFDAIIAIGAVIRGDTYHFEVVSNESARGLGELSLQLGIPVINGVLTTNTAEQAFARAETNGNNKGADAAVAALEMVSLVRRLDNLG